MTVSATHLLISASAGTGKTHALTARYLKLLRHGALPETILATTFTRKAAGEILARVLLRLAKAASSDHEAAKLAEDIKDFTLTPQDCRKLLVQLCDSLHSVTISTIDGFFNRVASSFRFELGIPPSPRIVDERDSLINQIRLRAIEALLADDQPQVLIDLLRRLHHDSNKRSVTDSIETIVSELYEIYREAPEEDKWNRLSVPPVPTEEQIRDIGNGLLAVCVEGAVPTKNLAKALRTCRELFEQRQWDVLVGNTIIRAVRSGKCTYGGTTIDPRVVAALEPLVRCVDAIAIQRVAQRGEASYDLVRRFDSHFTRLRHEQNVLLFSDLTHKLARELQTLGEQIWFDVYYRLDARVKHLLLDEFQDTSIDQWTVLQPVASEITASDDGTMSHSFFCVGDVKQAIYNWRGGCAEIFNQLPKQLNLRERSIKTLDKSHRSSSIVLDAVNAVFSDLAENPVLNTYAPIVQRWAQKFPRHEAVKSLPGCVELLTSTLMQGEVTVNEDSDGDDTAVTEQASTHEVFVAEKITALHRAVPGASIGVLVSTHLAASRLLPQLRNLGVDASGEGGVAITGDPAVLAILAALTLADHPGDSIAAFHVLHSPLNEIVGLGSQRSADCHAVAMRIRHEILNRGYADLIADWAQRLAPSCGPSSTRRLLQLIEIADSYDATITLRTRDFVEFVHAKRVEETSLSPVRVMTVHAAKGLEFDAVVMPELDRLIVKMTDLPAYVERDAPTLPISAVFAPANKDVRSLSSDLEKAYNQMLESRLRDDLSVLYVAMTRARHALYMIAKPLSMKKDGNACARGWSNLSYAAILRRALGPEQPTYEGGETLYSKGDNEWMKLFASVAPAPPVMELLRPKLAQSPSVAQRALAVVAPSSREAGGTVRAADLFALETSSARVRGSVFHAWFEQVEWMDSALPDDSALLQIAADVVNDLGRAGGMSGEARLRPLLAEFHRMLEIPSVRATLGRAEKGAELWRERPFIVRINREIMRGQFDRVVVHRHTGRQVTATLTDFKSDTVTADNLSQRVEAYRPQIDSYRAALAAMLKIPIANVTAKLLFINRGEVVDIH